VTLSAVIFDFDYTLTVPDCPRQEVLDEATEAVGAPDLSREEYLDAHSRHLDSDSRVPIFADILPEDAEVNPKELADAYRDKVAESLRTVEGVLGLLADLRGGYRLGLLTNGPSKAQRSKLDAFDWIDSFDAIAITGDLDAGKPDERAFRAILSDLGVESEESVYVGDDPDADVVGARDAGLYTIQVVWEDGPDRHPDADAYVERGSLAAELPGILDEL
jgi:putative hydrolase of the HAD superfamily